MAPSKGDPAEGEDEESASVGRRARSGGICPTRRHADDEARSAACTPAGEGGSRAVERRVVPGETRGKGAAADVVQEALPTCGCHIERYRHHDHHAVPRRRRPVRVGDGEGTSAAGAEEAVRTCGSYTDTPPRSPTPPPVSASTALGIKGGRGGRGPKNKRVEVSRGGVPMDGFEESVARCGFQNPRLVRRCPTQPGRDTTRGAQTGTAASCISVAAATGARGGGGGRGHDDYAGTSRPRAAQLHAPTMDLPAEIYDTGDIEGPSGSFTVNNVQGKFAGYVLHTGSSLEGPDSKALSVGDEVKCKEVIGDRIDQKGSIVLPEKLRFDFSHGTHFSSTRDAAEEDIAKGVQRITAVTAECAKQAVKLASSIETDINETSNLDGATLEKNADKTGLPTIGEEVKQLAQRVRDNSLKPQDYEAFSDFPDFVCSDKGGYAGSNNGKCNYISKMNFYLRDGSMSDDMMLVSDGEESSNYSLRFEELKDFKNFSNNAKEITHLRQKIDSDYYTEHKGYFCALCGSCKNMKKRRDETQLFVDLCGSSISLQKDLNTSNVNMLMEAACARAGLKSNDCYSTFSGKVLEPERLLSYYQIKRDCTIRVNPRIRGGKLLTIDFETWDDKMKDCPRDQTVELHRDLIGPDNERMGVNTVTYLSESLQFLAKQVLIGLCRNHFIGISFGGNFTSEHLLFDRGNFKFDDCVPIDKYSRRSALKDYHRIYEIFDKAFRAGNKPYPMHSGHLINFLARTPPLADPQSEATIAYLTNHYSLLSHSQRIKMSEVLDSLREMLDGNDFLNFKFAIGKINWTERIEEITAMSEVYFYHAKWNKFGTLIYIPYVNNDNASLLRFSDNFFKHARYPIQQLEAAFSLAMEKENFMPQLLFDCMIKFQNVVELAGPMGVKYCCSVDVEEFIQEVISMLGKNTLCCKRSDEASTS